MAKFTNRTTVRRVGDSLAVLLPHMFLRQLKIERGDQMVVSVLNDDTLTLTKVPFEFKERMISA